MARIRAAVDARAESGSDILVVARSDARQAESLEVGSWLTCLATLLKCPNGFRHLCLHCLRPSGLLRVLGTLTPGQPLRRRRFGALQPLRMLAPTCCL